MYIKTYDLELFWMSGVWSLLDGVQKLDTFKKYSE